MCFNLSCIIYFCHVDNILNIGSTNKKQFTALALLPPIAAKSKYKRRKQIFMVDSLGFIQAIFGSNVLFPSNTYVKVMFGFRNVSFLSKLYFH